MKKIIMLLFFLISVVSASSTHAQINNTFILENKALKLEIKKSPAPYIKILVHKNTSTAVISNPSSQNMFTIIIAKPDGIGLDKIDSSSAGNSSVHLESIAGGKKVIITYSGFKKANLAVKVTGVSLKDDPLTLWFISITNNSGRRIKSVFFPTIKAVPVIGNPADDFIILPHYSGTMIENPSNNLKTNQKITLDYPGGMSAQFITYQALKAGMYLASLDAKGYPKAISIQKFADGFFLNHTFQIPADAGKTWQSPYPVALGVTQGKWFESADIYKVWTIRQPWCAKTLVQRDDIPAWWKEGYDVHVLAARTYGADWDGGKGSGSYYPKLLQHLRTFKDKIDGNIVVMLSGWEKYRPWTAGDYFPVFDSENAKKAISDIKKEGFRPLFYLSGLYYTFENEGVDAEKIPIDEKLLSNFVVDGKTGKLGEYVLGSMVGKHVWKRHSYQFCVGAPLIKEFYRGIVDQTHQLGVDVLQMDQTGPGAGAACYSDQHKHFRGMGLYQTQMFQDLLQDMRLYGKGKNKDFILTHEEPHENLIQYLDGFHVREYKEKHWYRGYPGAVGIPLFSYLYHEYAIGYGGDSATLSKYNDNWLVRCHAVNLVTGRTPGGSVWNNYENMYKAHPRQIKMLRNHCRLLKTRAKDYLILGKMLHPYELKVPPFLYKISTTLAKEASNAFFEEPAILTSSWQAPDGRIGHLFVNLSNTAQQLSINLDTANGPIFPLADAAIYSSEDNIFKPLWQNVKLPKPFSMEINPLEVVFIELQNKK